MGVLKVSAATPRTSFNPPCFKPVSVAALWPPSTVPTAARGQHVSQAPIHISSPLAEQERVYSGRGGSFPSAFPSPAIGEIFESFDASDRAHAGFRDAVAEGGRGRLIGRQPCTVPLRRQGASFWVDQDAGRVWWCAGC